MLSPPYVLPPTACAESWTALPFSLGQVLISVGYAKATDPLTGQYLVSICQHSVQPKLTALQMLERPAVHIPPEEGGAVGQAGSLQERFLKQKSDFEGNILSARTHLNDLETPSTRP